MKQAVSSRPGMMPAMKSLPIELLVSDPYTIMLTLGGIRMPSVPPAASEPSEARIGVAALLQRRQRHGADGRRGGDRRTRGRREQRAAADVGVQQAARQPAQPGRQRDVHAVGDAGAQQQLAQQHEQRDAR